MRHKRRAVRTWIVALTSLGALAVALALAWRLAGSDPELRTWAAWTLGRLHGGGAPAVPALVRALNEDTDAITRWCAAEALGRIGSAARPALPDLEKLESTSDPMLRRHVASALRCLRGG